MLVKQAKHLFICMKITKYLFVCLKITWRDMSYGRACDGRTERIRNNTTGLELRTKTEEMDEDEAFMWPWITILPYWLSLTVSLSHTLSLSFFLCLIPPLSETNLSEMCGRHGNSHALSLLSLVALSVTRASCEIQPAGLSSGALVWTQGEEPFRGTTQNLGLDRTNDE